jgi:hypothetical protein
VHYGINRPDVVAAMAVETDPNSPLLGFSYDFDTTTIANSRYTLEIRIVDKQGASTNFGARQITVNN